MFGLVVMLLCLGRYEGVGGVLACSSYSFTGAMIYFQLAFSFFLLCHGEEAFLIFDPVR